MKKHAGWKQLASASPRNKFHYFVGDIPVLPGWFYSVCGMFGMKDIHGFDDPLEKRKCKICLNYLRGSEVNPA